MIQIAVTFPYSVRRMSGIGAVVRSLTEFATRAGINAMWIVPAGGGDLFFTPPNGTEVCEIRTKWGAHGQNLALAGGTMMELLRRRREVELVHAHQPHLQSLASIFVARIRGVPSVVTIHGRVPRPRDGIRRTILGWIERMTFAWADAVIFVSEESARWFGSGIGRVIHNGVRTDRSPLSPDRRSRIRAGWDCGDVPVVLFTGRFSRLKGLFNLLDAVEQLAKGGFEFRLVLIGNGSADEEISLEEAIRTQGLEQRARMFGATENYQEALGGADIFALPSHLEGLPIGLLEAMASGLPVVATYVGGIPEAVRDGLEGRLVQPGDVESLRDALAWMLSHPKERAAMGIRAAERVRTDFSEQRMAQKYLDVYRTLVGLVLSP